MSRGYTVSLSLGVYVHCAFTDASHRFTVKCIIYISVFIVKVVEVFSGRSFAVSFVHRLFSIAGQFGLKVTVMKRSTGRVGFMYKTT